MNFAEQKCFKACTEFCSLIKATIYTAKSCLHIFSPKQHWATDAGKCMAQPK